MSRPRFGAWLVAGLLACSPALPAAAQTLRYAGAGDLQTLDPHAQNESLTNVLNGQVYERLVMRDRQLAIVPQLATGWQQLSPTRWRFALRPGVKFHEGQPFTADDVVFSVERARQPSSQIATYAAALGEVRKIDALTVEFTQKTPNPIFLHHLDLIYIMSKAWCEQHGVMRPQSFKDREETYAATHANGTGPFVVAQRQAGVQTAFKRFAGWWGKPAGNLQQAVYHPIANDATRSAALLSGEIDLVIDPPPRDVARLRRTPGVKIVDGPENRILFLGMDQARDKLLYGRSPDGKNPFKDLRVRRALYQAIDIEAIRGKLMNGMAAPTGAVVASSLADFNDPQIEARLPYDPAQARALLAQAGYASGFEVTLDCPNNRYVNDEAICVALAAMWDRVGVKVRVNALPKATLFPKMERLDTSFYLFGWGGAITDAETTFTPLYRNRGTGGVGEYNRGNFRDDKLDALAAASSAEPDPAKRKALILATFRRMQEQVHYIPLHRQFIPWAAREQVDLVHRADNWLELAWVTLRP